MNANTTINQDVESTITAIEPSVGSAKNIQTNVEVNFNITPHERWQQSGDPATESSSVTQDNLTQIPDPVNTTILGDGSCGIHSMMFIIITAHQNQAKTSIQIPNNNTVIQGIRSHPYYRSHPNQLSQDLKKLYADMHNINPPGIDIQLTQTDEYRRLAFAFVESHAECPQRIQLRHVVADRTDADYVRKQADEILQNREFGSTSDLWLEHYDMLIFTALLASASDDIINTEANVYDQITERVNRVQGAIQTALPSGTPGAYKSHNHWSVIADISLLVPEVSQCQSPFGDKNKIPLKKLSMYAHQSTEGASRYAKQIEQTLNEIESKCNEKLYLKRHMLETLREYLIRVRNNIRQQTSLANQPLSRSQKSRFMNIVAELSKRLSRTDDQLRVNEECLQRYHRLDKVIDFLLMLVDRLFKDTTLCCDKYQYIELTNSPSI